VPLLPLVGDDDELVDAFDPLDDEDVVAIGIVITAAAAAVAVADDDDVGDTAVLLGGRCGGGDGVVE
jgi:hypothetical protein